jgi:site-specific recombinase XerD
MDSIASIHPVPAAWLRDSDLAPFMPAYWRGLVEQRYSAGTARVYLYCVAHFARWASRCRLAVVDLTDGDIQRFLDDHLPMCTCPQPVQRSRHQLRAALRLLLAMLGHAGILVDTFAPDAVEDELRRFDAHMLNARGLAQNTRDKRLGILRPFLQQFCISSVGELKMPTAQDLRQFIKHELDRWSPASAGALGGALRAYVRFCATRWDQVGHLLPVIASPANWRLAPLPQTLSPDQLTRLLGAFPPEMASGRRAYAMLRCVVDLGLRASEVVNLGLDDIDWVAGTLRVGQNKSRRVHLLPLLRNTASAIATYLRSERPETTNRRVFVRHIAPFDVPVGPDVVRNAIRAAFQRCAITHTRVYALRHTLASRLLGEGGTLKEVADVLRHRDLDTTLIYAKVDSTRLAAVAMPWPGSAV